MSTYASWSECRWCNNENPECKDCGGYHETRTVKDGVVVDDRYIRNRPKAEMDEMWRNSMEYFWNDWHYQRAKALLDAAVHEIPILPKTLVYVVTEEYGHDGQSEPIAVFSDSEAADKLAKEKHGRDVKEFILDEVPDDA